MQPEEQAGLIPAPTIPDPAAAKERRVPDAPLLLLACLALFALRAWLARGSVTPNFDTATVGLMGLDILAGARPLFYYGQNYMGALEAYVAAGFFALLGPSAFALALAPVLFSVGWAAATWGVFRALYGRTAAWAAFLLLALPGWTVLRVSLNSYGGYTACFFLGTLAWWMAVRAWQSWAPGRWLPGIGLAAGLALWTNFQSATHLFLAGLFTLAALARGDFRRWRAPALLAAVLFLAAVSPVWLLRDTYQGGHVAALQYKGASLSENAGILFGRLLGWMVHGRPDIPAALRGALYGVFACAGLLAIARAIRLRPGGLAGASPWLGCLFFLAVYLGHPLAAEGASRYLVPFWTLLCSAVFALPLAAGSRLPPALLLAAWTALQAGVCVQNHPARQREAAAEARHQAEVVRIAAAAGARTVVLSHDLLWNLQGQAYTFAATNGIQFVSIGDERRQDRAEAAEAAAEAALAFPPGSYDRMKATFASLGLAHRRIPSPDLSFADRFVFPPVRCAPVKPAEIRRWREAGIGALVPELSDAAHGAAAEGAVGEGLWIDLGQTRRIEQLWLISPHPFFEAMPTALEIHASADNIDWRLVHAVSNRYANAYTLQRRVYVNGFLGRFQAAVGAETRFLRLRFPAAVAGAARWRIEELIALEAVPGDPFSPPEEPAAMLNALQRHGSPFLAGDRWISARLRAAGHAAVYPRFNTKVLETVRARDKPLRPGVAFAVPSAWVPFTLERLNTAWPREGGVVIDTVETGAYTVLFTRPDPPGRAVAGDAPLIWNDHLLMTGRAPLWR